MSILKTFSLNSFIRLITFLCFARTFFWSFILFFHLELIPLYPHFDWLSFLFLRIKQSSYLSWSWRNGPVWGGSSVDLLHLRALADWLELEWMWADGRPWRSLHWGHLGGLDRAGANGGWKEFQADSNNAANQHLQPPGRAPEVSCLFERNYRVSKWIFFPCNLGSL